VLNYAYGRPDDRPDGRKEKQFADPSRRYWYMSANKNPESCPLTVHLFKTVQKIL
jgi:hypothetical protein